MSLYQLMAVTEGSAQADVMSENQEHYWTSAEV